MGDMRPLARIFLFCVVLTGFVIHATHVPGRHRRGIGGPRPGMATETNSCQHIRAVPVSLRSADVIKPKGIGYFYQKYTEAYGIPVLSSVNVPDDALKRACYVLRFLLADHSGVRQSFYAHSGRVAVIGVDEGTTSIPEMAYLSPWWNKRARGLGALPRNPISSAGEENVLCYKYDRYHNEDIFLHETSHGVHTLGARFAIPGWDTRLLGQYQTAKGTGLWVNTYSMSTYLEYFAEGTQSFFDVNNYSKYPNGVTGPISTKTKLKSYDPALYKLIQEVFPCGNTFIKRCLKNRTAENEQDLRMNCDLGEGKIVSGRSIRGNITEEARNNTNIKATCGDKNSDCPCWATEGYCNTSAVFMHNVCQASCGLCTLGVEGITTPKPAPIVCKDLYSNCTEWKDLGECVRSPTYMHKRCRQSCGLCGEGAGFEPTPPVCEDQNDYCNYWLGAGECDKTPAYMVKNCRRACGWCSGPSRTRGGARQGMTNTPAPATQPPSTTPTKPITLPPCKDWNQYCQDWQVLGECVRNPLYMSRYCTKSCGLCGTTTSLAKTTPTHIRVKTTPNDTSAKTTPNHIQLKTSPTDTRVKTTPTETRVKTTPTDTHPRVKTTITHTHS